MWTSTFFFLSSFSRHITHWNVRDGSRASGHASTSHISPIERERDGREQTGQTDRPSSSSAFGPLLRPDWLKEIHNGVLIGSRSNLSPSLLLPFSFNWTREEGEGEGERAKEKEKKKECARAHIHIAFIHSFFLPPRIQTRKDRRSFDVSSPTGHEQDNTRHEASTSQTLEK